MLLMPGFLQVGYYYFFSSQVRRSVVYGDQPRNRLDLYLPKDKHGLKPVVAFVTGGAYIIGYKAWGCLLGRRLSERGIIVACIDYRNFPQGTISDMVKDASQGISFVCNNIASIGGDPNRIYLAGQSAGAHIAAYALLDQAFKECGEGENTSWSVSQIKAYFGISGGYNMLNLVNHFHGRGLYKSIFLSIMEGEEGLKRFSPQIIVKDLQTRHAATSLPKIILFHGTTDYSIPSETSKNFADALQGVGAQVELVLYEGKTHTDLFLQEFTVDSKVMVLSHPEAVRKLHAWRTDFDKSLKRSAFIAYESNSLWDSDISSIFDRDNVPRSTLCALIELSVSTVDLSRRLVPPPPPWSRRDVSVSLSRPPPWPN